MYKSNKCLNDSCNVLREINYYYYSNVTLVGNLFSQIYLLKEMLFFEIQVWKYIPADIM